MAGDKQNANEKVLGGNIALVGFEILEPAELTIVKKLVGNYVKKMCNNGEYQEMKITLQQHPHGKSFKHELKAMAIFREGRFSSEAMEWNLYNALAQVCDKIIEELKQTRRKEDEHKLKKYEVTKEDKKGRK